MIPKWSSWQKHIERSRGSYDQWNEQCLCVQCQRSWPFQVWGTRHIVRSARWRCVTYSNVESHPGCVLTLDGEMLQPRLSNQSHVPHSFLFCLVLWPLSGECLRFSNFELHEPRGLPFLVWSNLNEPLIALNYSKTHFSLSSLSKLTMGRMLDSPAGLLAVIIKKLLFGKFWRWQPSLWLTRTAQSKPSV